MKNTVSALILVLAGVASCIAVSGCSSPQPTPPEVAAEFADLLEQVDADLPGASVARLREFARAHRELDIAPEIEHRIDDLRASVDGRYHQAREMARENDFDGAETILEDLATHLSDTPDGKSAKEHLAFDFYYGQAQWHMLQQRPKEGGEVARRLLEKDLSRSQQEQVETILDNAGYVGAAMSQAVRSQAQVATRQLLIYLEVMFAEEGRYPDRLTLPEVRKWDPSGSRSIFRHLSAIEDYSPAELGVSFVAVSEDGEHRIRVVEGMMER